MEGAEFLTTFVCTILIRKRNIFSGGGGGFKLAFGFKVNPRGFP